MAERSGALAGAVLSRCVGLATGLAPRAWSLVLIGYSRTRHEALVAASSVAAKPLCSHVAVVAPLPPNSMLEQLSFVVLFCVDKRTISRSNIGIGGDRGHETWEEGGGHRGANMVSRYFLRSMDPVLW